jgi:hypothetical protein
MPLCKRQKSPNQQNNFRDDANPTVAYQPTSYSGNDGDPLRALHSRDQDSSGPARDIFVLYLYYSVVDAGCQRSIRMLILTVEWLF